MRQLHKTRLLCGLLTLCILLSALGSALYVSADTVKTGKVVATGLSVRTAPNTGATFLGYLSQNETVTIYNSVTDSSGNIWYQITGNALSGYACAQLKGQDPYIVVNASYEYDEKFEAHLTAQNFPEDYKAKLRAIHAQYPKWVFKAEHLKTTWAAALAEECKFGVKTVNTAYESWKSMEYGAYNWDTGTYVNIDGGYVMASPSLVAYYLDPRNFLDAVYIFQFEDLSFSNEHTVDGVQAILPTALDKHAADLLAASKAANVSAYFLATRMTQEQGSNPNALATGTVPNYTGYYNFFNYGASPDDGDNDPNDAVENGAKYAKNQGWDTPYKCLLGSAQKIGANYISIGQDTLYYQNFNVINERYNHQYMTNVQASASEAYIRHSGASANELNSNLAFTIPVFKEMPSTVAKRPSTSGNNNNFLESITVSGCDAISPTFNRYTHNYSTHAGSHVSGVQVSVKLSNSAASVAGAGTIALKSGSNVINITVTATSGEKRTYTLTITKEGGSASAPTVTSSVYTITDTITGVEPNTLPQDFVKNLAVTNGSAAVYAANGSVKASGAVATGDILRLSGESTVSYPIVIYGDVNGDGLVTSADLRTTQKHILGISQLSGYYFTAADSGKNGGITSADLRTTQKFILGVTKSLQK